MEADNLQEQELQLHRDVEVCNLSVLPEESFYPIHWKNWTKLFMPSGLEKKLMELPNEKESKVNEN